MTYKIAFFDAKPYDVESFDAVNKEYGYEIRYIQTHLTSQSVVMASEAEVVCAFVNDTLDCEVIEELVRRGTKLIAMRCAGYNNVDLTAAENRLRIVHVPAYSPHAVAEHAMALLLSLNRKTHKAYFRTRDGNFSIVGLAGFDLNNKTAGVIGTGRIGATLAGIMRGFGMRVIAYDKYPNQELAEKYGFAYVDFETLLRESKVISLNCPLTNETYHLLNKEAFSLMTDGVVIINTGRGKLVDTKALIDALKSGKVGAAGLDVYEEESGYFFEDLSANVIEDDVLARLLTFSNVLVTSHQGFLTKEALKSIARTTLCSIRQFETGAELENEVSYTS